MPHQRPSKELQDHGQILYRRKEYAKALELFNEAITSEPNLTVSLLDNRAATYEKLDDTTSALKDAKSAIRLHEKDPTGYLRAGKLLEKAGKPDVALSIYKHGIKKQTKNVQLLVKMHDKLLRSTAPPTAADPFVQLPLELVEMILAHLSFRQIVCCTRVSKQWNLFIASIPGLWSVLDLSETRKRVKNDFISLCLNRSQRRITYAHLKRLAGSEKAITALARHCKDLRSLSISDGGIRSLDFVQQLAPASNLTRLTLGQEAPMGLDSVPQLLRELTSLRHIEILAVMASRHRASWAVDLPLLQTLNIGSAETDAQFEQLNLKLLLQRTPDLRSLRVFSYRARTFGQSLDIHNSCPKLEILDISRCDLGDFTLVVPAVPQAIRVLRINWNRARVATSIIQGQVNPLRYLLPCLEELEIPCPVLASLLLSNPNMLDNLPSTVLDVWAKEACIMRIFQERSLTFSKLKYLNMPQLSSETAHLLTLLSSPRLSHIQHLRLTGDIEIDDIVCESIASHCANVKTVDLSHTAITGCGVRSLVNGCSKLETLKVDGGARCSSDALEWARAKGVKVNAASSKPEGKGRRMVFGT